MRLLPVLIAGSLLSGAVSATDPGTGLDAGDLAVAERLRERALQGNEAWSLVESLTTEVGPRPGGSPGDARAVAWAQAKFKALGYDRVYLEPVSYPVWHRGREQAQVLAPFPQPLVVTALGGSVGTGEQPLEAEVVRFADLAALMAAAPGSLEGRIAFVDYRIERHRDGHGYSPGSKIRASGASEAARKGAIGFLIRSAGTDDDRLAHTGMMRYAEDAPKIPAAALSNPDADQLARILARGGPARLRLELDVGFKGEVTSHNVIGEIRGRGLAAEVVTMGGHLDSWDLGTGAIDDASGVGITMAAGALIGRLERAPRRTVRVIAYANEEHGLHGGKAYAAARVAAGEVAAHQLGAESDFGAGRIYALRAGLDAAAWPVIAKIGEVLAPLGIATEPGTGSPGPDVGPMHALGAPWAQLAQDGTDYFDYHHTANDTLDKVDAKALDQQVAAYAVLAYLAAESEIDFGKAPLPKTE